MQWKNVDDDSPVNSVEDMPQGTFGFIYCLIYEDGSRYIGKKNLYSEKTLPALKSGELRPNSSRVGRNKGGKRIYFDVVRKESNWKKYRGSSKDTQDLQLREKYLLCYAGSKRELTYLEVKMLFVYEVLEDDTYLNKNIINRWFKGNIV